MRKFIDRVKQKYNLASDGQFYLIVIIFSIAGTTDSLAVKSFLNSVLPPYPKVSHWVYACVYIAIAVPMYQLFMLVYGFLGGQFNFFWERHVQARRAFARLCKRFAAVLLAVFINRG